MTLGKLSFVTILFFIVFSTQAQVIPLPKIGDRTALSTDKNAYQKQQDSIVPAKPIKENNKNKSQIEIIYGGDFLKKQDRYPNASIFLNDGNQVQFRHEDVNLWCDFALFYQVENIIKASGNVRLQQGDSIEMTSRYLEYDGNTSKALSRDSVKLITEKAILTTDTLYYDRLKQEAFYDDYGTLKDTSNTLKSKEGTYYMKTKRVKFNKDVTLNNKDFEMKSETLYYYPNSKNVYFTGPTTITGESYKVYGERGFYDTSRERGYFLKNAKIDYDNRTVYADSIYYDEGQKFTSLTNHVKVIDTINKSVLHGHYAEVFKNKDSILVTKQPVIATLQEKDSLFIHGDTVILRGKEKKREVLIYHKVRLFGSNLSAKSDSLFSSEKQGVTKMVNNPIAWYGNNQITGKEIHLKIDIKTEKLDSIEVHDDTFIISKDSLDSDAFNQIKGKDLYGRMENGMLKTVDIIKNCQVIYYIFDDKNKLVGINKTNSDAINVVFKDQDINQITFLTNPVGDIFPEFDIPKNARRLKDFDWRGKERIKSKAHIFNDTIILPIIKGLDSINVNNREKAYNKIIRDTLPIVASPTLGENNKLKDSLAKTDSPSNTTKIKYNKDSTSVDKRVQEYNKAKHDTLPVVASPTLGENNKLKDSLAKTDPPSNATKIKYNKDSTSVDKRVQEYNKVKHDTLLPVVASPTLEGDNKLKDSLVNTNPPSNATKIKYNKDSTSIDKKNDSFSKKEILKSKDTISNKRRKLPKLPKKKKTSNTSSSNLDKSSSQKVQF